MNKFNAYIELTLSNITHYGFDKSKVPNLDCR